ncbi:hypothetical protein UMZ34_05415 [Halopseudomonas pachastrellae]|nr:hypothetical protein UMZ34_05415 [Halopseudomonas pachastrellae]
MAGYWYLTDSLDVSLAWATAQSEIRKHRDASLEGNRVTGVPSHTTTTAQLNWRPLTHWETSLTLRDIGDYAVNASNQLVDGGYRVTDLRWPISFRAPGLSRLPGGGEPDRQGLCLHGLHHRVCYRRAPSRQSGPSGQFLTSAHKEFDHVLPSAPPACGNQSGPVQPLGQRPYRLAGSD